MRRKRTNLIIAVLLLSALIASSGCVNQILNEDGENKSKIDSDNFNGNKSPEKEIKDSGTPLEILQGKDWDEKEFAGTKFKVWNLSFVPTHEIIKVNGSLAFRVNEEQKTFGGQNIIYKGERIGEKYELIDSLFEVEGKIGYWAATEQGTSIVLGGEEHGKKDKSLHFPQEIGGKLAYTVTKDIKDILIWDGKEISKGYKYPRSYTEVRGEPVFIAGPYKDEFIVKGGKEVSDHYKNIEHLKEIGGKLTFKATKQVGEFREEEFIVHNGEKLGKEFDYISEPFECDGKLLFRGTINDKEYIYYNGYKEEWNHCPFYKVKDVDGNKAYLCSGSKALIYKGKRIGREFDRIYTPFELNGKLFFFAAKGEPLDFEGYALYEK